MTATFDDYILQSSVGRANVWVQFTNNLTGLTYVSVAATDTQGRYTITVPNGTYSVAIGNSSGGPWTATGDVNYLVDTSDGAVAGALISAYRSFA